MTIGYTDDMVWFCLFKSIYEESLVQKIGRYADASVGCEAEDEDEDEKIL
jgi:hypothetical protein